MEKDKKDSFFKYFSEDIRSGLVVFLIALPLCLGVALASGAPLFAGIVSGIVGGILVGYLSGSSVSVSGPAAGLTVIVMSGIGSFKIIGGVKVTDVQAFQAFLLAVVIAGLLQIVFGYIKAGKISLYFPTAVIKGMLTAIGITLILKQIPHALGDDKDFEGEFEFFQLDGSNTFTEIINALGDPAFGAVIISAVAFVILIYWGKLAKRYTLFQWLPGSLVAVISGVLLNALFERFFPNLVL
ncbi:MAG: SulP family inorganic anion transporter, partial [Verrucomicrobia bacterium]|nr:SulP family inorganic anion transporter [Cytophagales bacterium]